MTGGGAWDHSTVGPYRLVSRLGEGGMGVVHLAVGPDDRAVAIKVLKAHVAADPDARLRLAREVATLRRVRHPRVAEVLDADVDGPVPYLVTRFVPGRTLDDLVRERGPMPLERVVHTGRVLADALRSIHAAGVVHRDVKPANVMLPDDDPVLIDFGIAHVADESRITMTGLVMGTPGYLSPEVVAGHPVTPATDWWGWGSTLAFAATGRAPFGTGPIEVVLDRVRRGDADLTGLDPRLRSIVATALAAEPGTRPPADWLIGALEDVLTNRTANPAAAVTVATPAPGRPGPAPTVPAAAAAAPTVATPPPADRRPDRQAPTVVHAHSEAPTAARPGRENPAAAAPTVRTPPPAAATAPYRAMPTLVDAPALQPKSPPAAPGGLGMPGSPPAAAAPAPARPAVGPVAPRNGVAVRPPVAPPLAQPVARPALPPALPSSGTPPTGTTDPAAGPGPGGLPLPERPTALLLAGLVALAATATVAPGGAVVLLWLWMVVARTADRSALAVWRRRYSYGPRSSDVPLTVALVPWRMLVAGVMSLLSMLVPLAVGASVAFLAGSALTGGTSLGTPTEPVALGLAGAAAAVTAWWGPGGGSMRRGTTWLGRLAVRRRGLHLGLLVFLAFVVVAALITLANGASPDFAPFQDPPLLG